MKSVFIFLLFFLTSITGAAQDFSLYQKKYFVDPKGDTLPYRILYPDHYDQTKKYPLILFLHGGGERGKDNEKQLVHGARLFIDSAVRKEFPAIVIAPQCPADSYWASVKFERTKYPLDLDFNYQYPITKGLRLAIALTNQIIKKEKVDTKKVYITGLSMGGMGSLEAVYRYPKLFAAAAVVCGGGDVKAYSKKQTKTAFWLFHGDADSVVPVKHSREMFERLKELKADANYTEYERVDHNSWDTAYAPPAFLEWMFSKHK
jgi:predicted peptidase